MNEFIESVAKRVFLKSLSSIRKGHLTLLCGAERFEFGKPGAEPSATVEVHKPRFFGRAVLGGNTGLGEAWMDGDWSSPDLVSVVRLAVRNMVEMGEDPPVPGWLLRLLELFRYQPRNNSIEESRKNASAHYDLSNEFFQTFLDPSLMYSCARFSRETDSLETAQIHKMRGICEKLQLSSSDHLLEIGTGWGGFAEYAVRNYGCRVTTTTISERQHAFARQRFAGTPEGKNIELLKEDYRNLRGLYDKVVSIEMFEAVGLRHYDAFFSAVDRLLKPKGVMVMQTITINEQAFPAYRRRSDWIQKYIFPGGELASVLEILRSLSRSTALSLYHAEDIGAHYARTLAAWRSRFQAKLAEVRSLGFDERFIRTWDYYLAYCEAAFLERHVGDFQLILTKNHNSRPLYAEPFQPEVRFRAIPARGA